MSVIQRQQSQAFQLQPSNVYVPVHFGPFSLKLKETFGRRKTFWRGESCGSKRKTFVHATAVWEDETL